MEKVKIINPGKQKYGLAKNIISEFQIEIRKKKNKERTYKRYLTEFYEALIKLPYPFQMSVAAGWLQVVAMKSGDDFAPETYKYNKAEKGMSEYIEDISKKTADFTAEFNEIRSRISSERKEICYLLNSQTLRIGRMLSNNKTDLKKYVKYCRQM